jgi:hypothetical protein
VKGVWWTRRPAQEAREDRPDITLSQIQDFQFCPRGWWLRRTRGLGGRGAEQRQGALRHAQAGAAVLRAVQLERAVQGLVGLAVLVTLLAVAGLALRTF